VGPCVGRMFIFLGIHHLGVSRAIPLKSVQPLFVAVLAYTLLGERPGPYIWLGTILIVAGCGAFSIKKKDDTSWNRRLIWLPLASVVAFGTGSILRKVGLEMLPAPLVGVGLTSLSGLIFFLGFCYVMPPQFRPDLRQVKAWYFYGACGLVNILSFTLSIYALLYGDVTIVAPFSAMSPFFALVMSYIFLRDVERVTRLVVLGTVFTVAGGALIGWRIL
jgi:drug/metabolite transporter (DMT)-like permease